jgi:hypothetical protein
MVGFKRLERLAVVLAAIGFRTVPGATAVPCLGLSRARSVLVVSDEPT